MSIFEITQYIIYGIIALGAAVILILGFTTGLHFEPRIRKIASALLPTILIFGLGASTLFSTRDTNLYGITDQLVSGSTSSIGLWILRISTALTVGLSSLVIVSALLMRQKEINAAKPLFTAFSVYFFSAYVIGGIFGSEPTISYKTFYPFIVIFALYITSDYDEKLMVRLARNGLIIFLIIGLFLIFIKPDLVMQKNYRGFIPGISGRFWGLASHANNIAPLAIFVFLLVCWTPYKNWITNALSILFCAITLLLAQSKTSFISLIIIILVFMLRLWYQTIFQKKDDHSNGILTLYISMFIIIILLATFISDIYSQYLDNLISKIKGHETLFTGRENIWAITIAEWLNNPLFGYGPNLWGEEFSARFGYLGIASNAHNQFFDTLGSSGLIGITGLSIYLYVLIKYSLKLSNSSRWISVTLIVFLATRSFSEVPIKTTNITTSDFIMHALILGIFMRSAVRHEKGLVVDPHADSKILCDYS